MLSIIRRVWRDCFTQDAAGTVYCPIRFASASFVGLFHSVVGWQLIKTGAVDLQAYATAASTLVASCAAAIGIKRKLGADHE